MLGTLPSRTRCSATRAPRGGHKPRKSYGQHFLTDSSVLLAIVQQARLTEPARVLEIGPGTGNLTAGLLGRGVHVTAVEADVSLLPQLHSRFENEISKGQLHLHGGDITRLDVAKLLADGESPDSDVKVVANLPFNITTAVLKLLLPMSDLLSELYVMLQLEAALRLTGHKTGNSDYRAMSVLVDFYSTASLGMRIGRASFDPPPHVDCAMARFELRPAHDRLSVPSEDALVRLVNVCFSARRKTIKNSLSSVFDPAATAAALEKLQIQSNLRPQDLDVRDFAALCCELA